MDPNNNRSWSQRVISLWEVININIIIIIIIYYILDLDRACRRISPDF